jgi:predicted amidophosphoribosyltransferase
MICTLCETMLPQFVMPPVVCPACEAEVLAGAILRRESFNGSDVLLVFEYEHYVRQLIVRSKIQNDIVALGFLLKYVARCANATISRLDSPTTLVIPAPPSFWGRIRGRFDVAQMAALTLFAHADIYCGTLPGSLFRPKRAGRNIEKAWASRTPLESLLNSNTIKYNETLVKRISEAEHILVVDDVLTTGFTMKSLIDQLKRLGARSVEGLVLASVGSDVGEGLNEFLDGILPTLNEVK